MELQVDNYSEEEEFWLIFVHASTDARVRQEQWEELKKRKQVWGIRWVLGGDFNEIKNQEKKRKGTERSENSF